jgi:apolipoprotein N-acyltransferase
VDFLADVRRGVFRELEAGQVRIDPYRRNLQRAYLELLAEKLNGRQPVTDDARPLLRGELRSVSAAAVAAAPRAADRTTRLHLEDLHVLTRMLEERGADLVVWPEVAYPFRLRRHVRRDLGGPEAILGPGVRGPVLTGAVTLGPSRTRYNSVVAVARDGTITGIADKVRLLAFGEYVPLWDYLPPIQSRFPRGLSPGLAPVVLEVDGHRAGVLNCYEDVLADAARQVALGRPDFLVNVTNDAWFGDTTEPYLHQTSARLRAIETRRDLVRAVNTGVSSFTLATGEDAIETETWTRDAFVATVRPLEITTPWVRLGDWVTPLLAALLLASVVVGRRPAAR